MLTKIQRSFQISPTGNYLVWWNRGKQVWMGMDVRTRHVAVLTKKIPHPLYNEQHDRPFQADTYGTAGWLKNDAALLVYDKHDIWAVDPTGKQSPKCLTEEYGRKHNLRFRRMRLNPDEREIDPKGTLFLSAFNLKTKASGY